MSAPVKITEHQLHVLVADWLRLNVKETLWSHIPLGSPSWRQGTKEKRLGVNRGFPDFIFILEGQGKLAGLELKRQHPKTYQSKEQKEFERRLKKAGGLYRVCRSLEEVEGTLRAWGIIKDRAA